MIKPTNQKALVVNGIPASSLSFSGHGTAKDVNYTDSGKALVTIRDNGKVINTKGQAAIMTSSGDKASLTFEEIGHLTASGASFFDANATGKLAFLGNTVAIYKDTIYKNGTDTVIAWERK
jgi:sorbitol-specific phosphotransferase system component IIA